METLNCATMPTFTLCYDGHDMTADIAPHVLAILYSDRLGECADSLEIDIDARNACWLNSWYPHKGAQLDFRFGYRHNPLIYAGAFELDEIQASGPPSRLSLRARATGGQRMMRTRISRAYEHTTLQAIVEKMARRLRMTLIGEIEALPIDRATQYQESDLAFLHRLATQYGYLFKITDNHSKLVFWRMADLAQGAVQHHYTPAELTHWQLCDSLSQVPAAVRLRYHHPRQRSLIRGQAQLAESLVPGDLRMGCASSVDIVQLTRRAPTQASANLQAQRILDARTLLRTRGRLTLTGNPSLAAGQRLELTGLGLMGGRYLITRATHAICRTQGYTTTLDIQRLPPFAAHNTPTSCPAVQPALPPSSSTPPACGCATGESST